MGLLHFLRSFALCVFFFFLHFSGYFQILILTNPIAFENSQTATAPLFSNFFFTDFFRNDFETTKILFTMIPRYSTRRRQISGRAVHPSSERQLLTFPPERRSVNLVRRPGGILSVPPGKLAPPLTETGGGTRRLTKLLLNVTIERSLGPVQVVISSENTVSDLVKAAIEIYVAEKRRPFLPETDPHRFDLHYSQFSLESK